MGKNLTERVALIEERLGLDADAIAADEAARLERGAEAATVGEAELASAGGQDVAETGEEGQ